MPCTKVGCLLHSFLFSARMNHTVLVGSIGEYWDYCGHAKSCGYNRTQYSTNWNEYLDSTTPGTCAEYEGGMCEEFVPIGSRIFVSGNVNISDLDSRADSFLLSTDAYSFLPRSCRCRDLFYLPCRLSVHVFPQSWSC
jgi:hypothetical protein